MNRKSVTFIAAVLLLQPMAATAQGTFISGAPQTSAPLSGVQIVNRTQDPFAGSASQERPNGVIDLSLRDAIERGLDFKTEQPSSEALKPDESGIHLRPGRTVSRV